MQGVDVPLVAIVADRSKWNGGGQRLAIPRVFKGSVGYTISRLVLYVALLGERVKTGRVGVWFLVGFYRVVAP